MEQNIVLTTELQEKFKTAWGQRQVILFTAPCGCGKSAAASALLEPYTVCRWDALSESLEPAPDFTCDAGICHVTRFCWTMCRPSKTWTHSKPFTR